MYQNAECRFYIGVISAIDQLKFQYHRNLYRLVFFSNSHFEKVTKYCQEIAHSSMYFSPGDTQCIMNVLKLQMRGAGDSPKAEVISKE